MYFVYSCGDGNILQHDPWKLDKPAVDLNKIISKKNDTRVRHNYRLRSEGDNACGSVCLSVRPSVPLFVLSRLNRLTYDLHVLHVGRP